MTYNSDSTKTWNGEPAALKGLILAVVTTIVAIVTGQQSAIDGTQAIVLAVTAFVVPIVLGFWIRRSVTPVSVDHTFENA